MAKSIRRKLRKGNVWVCKHFCFWKHKQSLSVSSQIYHFFVFVFFSRLIFSLSLGYLIFESMLNCETNLLHEFIGAHTGWLAGDHHISIKMKLTSKINIRKSEQHNLIQMNYFRLACDRCLHMWISSDQQNNSFPSNMGNRHRGRGISKNRR